MKILAITVVAAAMTATPLFAQEHSAGEQDPAGYVAGMGGFAASVGNKTGDWLLEGGVRIAPHLMVIGNVGRFGNLQAELQPTLDTTTASLANNDGLSVLGGGSVPTTYTTGGLRVAVPVNARIQPYVLGTVGVAHLTPTPQFTFTSGTMPDGSSPVAGADVTSALIASAVYTPPASSNAFMFTMGGGAQMPVAAHWMVDLGYRYSRIAADSTLSASPLNANAMTVGFGYRF